MITARESRKKLRHRKKKRRSYGEYEGEETGLKETLTEVNEAFCDKMAVIFTNVMEKASDREDQNIEKLVKTGRS